MLACPTLIISSFCNVGNGEFALKTVELIVAGEKEPYI